MGVNVVVSSFDTDLRNRPESILSLPEDTTALTIGDLHGNAIKLLHFLIAYGLIDLTDDQYHALVEIYNKPTKELSRDDFNRFNRIIDFNLTIKRSDLLVRLIGDELADRGNNDYFTLKILHWLHNKKQNVQTIVSNHGMEFMAAYVLGMQASPQKFDINVIFKNLPPSSNKRGAILTAQRRSAFGLCHCLAHKLIDIETFSALAQVHVKTLHLLSYEFSDQHGLTFYSHAPIDVCLIIELCYVFGLTEYIENKGHGISSHDLTDEVKTNPQKMIALINAINTAFLKDLNTDNSLELFNPMSPKGKVIYQTVWQRAGERTLVRPKRLSEGSYSICWVHGHDCAAPEEQHIINLDTPTLGKDNSPIFSLKPEDHTQYLKQYLENCKIHAAEGKTFYEQDFSTVVEMFSDIMDRTEIQNRYALLKKNYEEEVKYYRYIDDDLSKYDKNERGELKVLITSKTTQMEASNRLPPNTENWNKFDKQCQVAYSKINELRSKKDKNPRYKEAYDTAINMYFRLHLLRDLHQKELLTAEQFKTKALSEIERAEPTLRECRTRWKPVLYTLAVSITVIGLGYRIWKVCSGGSFWVKPPSDSKYKIIDTSRNATRSISSAA